MSLKAAVARAKALRQLAEPPLQRTLEPAQDACPDDDQRSRSRPSYLVRRVSETEPLADLFGVSRYPSLNWWTRHVHNAVQHIHENSFKHIRPFQLRSVCTGLGTEIVAMKALGMKFAAVDCSDSKKWSQQFLKMHHGRNISHLYGNMADQIGKTNCVLHGQLCNNAPAFSKADCLVGGPPCQPYSQQRPGRYNVATCPSTHPGYSALFGTESTGYVDVLEAELPLGFVLEEVIGFGRVDPSSDKSAMERFIEIAKRIKKPGCDTPWFAGMVVIKLSANVWLEINRERHR